MSKVKSAVILAAGMGTRLQDVLEHTPKGLLEIGGKTLILESLRRLTNAGIHDIIIVTGHASDKYQTALADIYPGVRYVTNKEFEITGSMHSLYQARELVSKDFLLLESDLLYEDRSVPALLNCQHDTTILISGKTNSGDEVYVCGKEGLVKRINKKLTDQFPCQGELVGISKISLEFYEKLCRYYGNNLESQRLAHYEECISELSSTSEVHYFKINDLVWTEIDNPEHLNRALNQIYPQIYGHLPPK